MGDVVEFPGRGATEQIVGQIGRDFTTRGSTQAVVSELPISADEWRNHARRTARQLGRPVETFEAHGQVHAVLKDWPATPEEEAITRARMRRAMDNLGPDIEPPPDR